MTLFHNKLLLNSENLMQLISGRNKYCNDKKYLNTLSISVMELIMDFSNFKMEKT